MNWAQPTFACANGHAAAATDRFCGHCGSAIQQQHSAHVQPQVQSHFAPAKAKSNLAKQIGIGVGAAAGLVTVTTVALTLTGILPGFGQAGAAETATDPASYTEVVAEAPSPSVDGEGATESESAEIPSVAEEAHNLGTGLWFASNPDGWGDYVALRLDDSGRGTLAVMGMDNGGWFEVNRSEDGQLSLSVISEFNMEHWVDATNTIEVNGNQLTLTTTWPDSDWVGTNTMTYIPTPPPAERDSQGRVTDAWRANWDQQIGVDGHPLIGAWEDSRGFGPSFFEGGSGSWGNMFDGDFSEFLWWVGSSSNEIIVLNRNSEWVQGWQGEWQDVSTWDLRFYTFEIVGGVLTLTETQQVEGRLPHDPQRYSQSVTAEEIAGSGIWIEGLIEDFQSRKFTPW